MNVYALVGKMEPVPTPREASEGTCSGKINMGGGIPSDGAFSALNLTVQVEFLWRSSMRTERMGGCLCARICSSWHRTLAVGVSLVWEVPLETSSSPS